MVAPGVHPSTRAVALLLCLGTIAAATGPAFGYYVFSGNAVGIGPVRTTGHAAVVIALGR